MPAWISAFDRLPDKFGNYFVKVNGMKDILRQEEFEKRLDRYETFFWLDESVQSAPISVREKPVSLMDEIKTGVLSERHCKTLANLFGIKKAEKICSRLK